MLFVMGASGRMGGAVLKHAALLTCAGSRMGDPIPNATQSVRFDIEDCSTHEPALIGCSTMFVMRPPSLTTREPFDRLMEAATRLGIQHIVCASVYGAEKSRLLPHQKMEAAICASGLPHTFLRPADFMQNLIDIHKEDICERNKIMVPAGSGRSAFVDVEDVGRACGAILQDPQSHVGKHYELTGPEALGFQDVASKMGDALGRQITYHPCSIPRFIAHQLRRGTPVTMTLVMTALYTVQRLSLAAPVKPDFRQLTGQDPRSFADYIRRHKNDLR